MQNIRVVRYGPNEGLLEMEPQPELKAARDFEAVLDEAEKVETVDGVVYADGCRVATVRRYWQGYIEPDDRSWIAWIRHDGVPLVYLDRDPETGAVREHLAGPKTVDMSPGTESM